MSPNYKYMYSSRIILENDFCEGLDVIQILQMS